MEYNSSGYNHDGAIDSHPLNLYTNKVVLNGFVTWFKK